MCVNGSAGAIGVETSLVQELRLALDYDGVSEFYGIGTEPASLQFTTLGTAQVSQNAPDAREKRGREGEKEAVMRFPEGTSIRPSLLTVLKDSLDVEPVGGAGLVVSALLQVRGQLAGADVVDDARVVLRYGVWKKRGR